MVAYLTGIKRYQHPVFIVKGNSVRVAAYINQAGLF